MSEEAHMLESDQVEELICLASTLDRAALVHHFRSFRGSFPIDFTNEFLVKTPVERLQHIFVAMCLQNQRLPDATAPIAA
jgi:hypothetical protein